MDSAQPGRAKVRRGFPDAIAAQFGSNLRRLRLRSGLSQDRLAPLAKLHRTEISLLERGVREARIGTMVKLAGPLEVSPLDLLEGIAWRWQKDDPDAGAFYVEDELAR